MIPGLDVDQRVQELIETAFASCADHFRQQIATRGVYGLLEDYDRVITSIETQRCQHGPDGSERSGEDWQYCCGVSYEYYNDLAVRNALETIVRIAGNEQVGTLIEQIRPLDDRLYALYEHGPARVGRWWNEGLPRGVIE